MGHLSNSSRVRSDTDSDRSGAESGRTRAENEIMEDRLEVGLQSSFEGITHQESTLKPLPLCRGIYLIQYAQINAP